MITRFFKAIGSQSRTAVGTILVALAVGCGGGTPFKPLPAPSLSSEIIDGGRSIYFGSVYPLSEKVKQPTYVYERRVDEHGRDLISTHITRTPSGTVVLADSATHASDYTLRDYTLHANQLGQKGSIKVQEDQISFQLVDETGDRSAVEQQSDPVVVGPTLVGYIVKHLDALIAGEAVDVRFAVLDRLETIGFRLEAVEKSEGQPAAAQQTRISMKPSSFIFGLVIDPIYFTFDTKTRKLVRLEGRVPSKVHVGDAWEDFDARVEYQFVADSYR